MNSLAGRRCPRRPWLPATRVWQLAAHLEVPRCGATGRCACGTVAGTVQATLPAGGPAAGPAEVAWVVVRPAQGRGYGKEAARSLVALLQVAEWIVVAHIHPGRLASQGWTSAPGCGSPPTSVTARRAGSAHRLRHHKPRPLRPHRRPHLAAMGLIGNRVFEGSVRATGARAGGAVISC
jgi:hypothetical protein